ncbi:hypothetical protein HAX54_016600 [Datura stramonium]|uniref:Uncharacterized protein n=1 Tax=Datura stramonium TaxID=4076 RepID=A0ABS8UJU1_DATST|nr:hypothetical protein [Datura stramonium]
MGNVDNQQSTIESLDNLETGPRNVRSGRLRKMAARRWREPRGATVGFIWISCSGADGGDLSAVHGNDRWSPADSQRSHKGEFE